MPKEENSAREAQVKRHVSVMKAVFGTETQASIEGARIVEAVFREWKALGLLGRYPRELFTWSIDYLTHDVGLLPDEQRAECMRAANELWTRYFTEEGSCAARAVTACQCRGDGKLYVECAVDAAPFSVLTQASSACPPASAG